MSSLLPTSGRPSSGKLIASGIERQKNREIERVTAQAEILLATDQAAAYLTSSALTNISTLVLQAESELRLAPAAAPYAQALLSAYSLNAARRISSFG